MANTHHLKVDFNKTVGTFKPMHGVGQPPLTGISNMFFPYLTRAGIPFSRLHDVGGWMGGNLYVDIPNLFRDFTADVNDPASYDFAITDIIIKGLIDSGCEPYFRLGVTIENFHNVIAYRIFPPADFQKWAEICEHIIRHYNEGWANGFHYNIRYWEIWNEPDDCWKKTTAAMWKGTPEEFYNLYSTTAIHLKKCFGDTIKVGGYGHCGLYEFAKDTELNGIEKEETIYDFTINFHHGFFKHLKEVGAPLDFFSWHVYDNCHKSTREDFKHIRNHAEYCRRLLDHYGFQHAEHHLNEWNIRTDVFHRDDPIVSARTLAFMQLMQDSSTDIMCFYDCGVGFSPYRCLINPDKGIPYRVYYSFMMFNTLYTLKKQVSCQVDGTEIFASAARDGRKAGIVLSNPTADAVTLDLDLTGFTATDMQFLRTDEENRYTLTGETIANNQVTLPAYGTLEIKLFDLSE